MNKSRGSFSKIIYLNSSGVLRKGGKRMIEKTTTIGEVLEQVPEKADILLEIGMHCLGCPASQMETIEEACEVHGMDVEEVLKRLNA